MNMFPSWTLPSDEDEPYRRVNEPEKKLKKRKWWQRRQKVEMQDGEDEKRNGVKGEEMGQGVGQKVLEDQADQIPKMEKQGVLGKNKPEKKVKKRKWWQRCQKVEMQDREDERGNEVMVGRESEGLENQVKNLKEQVVLKNQVRHLEEQAVLKDQRKKLVKTLVLVIEIEMKEVERQVAPLDLMPNLEKEMVLKNQAQRLEKQVLPMDQMKQVEERVVLKNHVQNLKVQAVQTNPMKKHEQQVALMVERDRLVGMGDWMNKMVEHVSKNMVLMIGTDKPTVDLMDQSGTLKQVGLQDQRDNLEAQMVLRNQWNESNKRVVLMVDRKKLGQWVVLIDQVGKPKQGGLDGRRKKNKNQVVLRYSKNNMNKRLVQMFQMEKLDSALLDMDEAPEHQWTELQDPAALQHQKRNLEEQNLDRRCTEDPLKNISKVSLNKPDHEELQDDVLVPPTVEAQPEESGALMETACEDEGVGVSVPADAEVEKNQPENQTPRTGYKILRGIVIGAAFVLTVAMASRRLSSFFNVRI